MTPATLARIRADVDQTLDLFTLLREAKTEIANHRRHNLHLTAAMQRDDMLCLIEQWLDPDGLVHRQELQNEQGKNAARCALDIDPDCGF
jgi:hypothetical protein